MTKIKVSRKVADALDYLLASELYRENRSHILKVQARSGPAWHTNTPAECLNGVDIMTIAEALVNGYEADMTPEEKLADKYSSIRHYESAKTKGFIEGIEYAIDTLGLKIKGINDHDD